jgi:hypothetical protein
MSLEPNSIKSYTASELASTRFLSDYLVEGILVAGQPAILAGPKKCLKTSVALDLALSLATQGMFLGKFRVKRQARVGFMSGESGMPTIQETAGRICTTMRRELACIEKNLIFTEWLPRFDNLSHLTSLEQWIINWGLEVVIIDPAYVCIPGEAAANMFKMGELLRSANTIFERTGSTMILVNHTRKNEGVHHNQYAPLELESIAWAGFQEFARQWVLLNRRKAYEPGSGEHRLWMSSGGSAGHSGLWAVDVEEGVYKSGMPRIWKTTVQNSADARQAEAERKATDKQAKVQEQVERDIEKLLNAVRLYPQGETKSILKEAAGLTTGKCNVALSRLLETGQIAPCTIPKEKQSYQGYRFTTPA